MVDNNNIIKHIKDDAKYVSIDKSDKDWLKNISNVQEFIEAIAPYSYNGVGLPNATELVAGIAKIATNDEVMSGVDNSKIVTPKTLKYRMDRPEASETVLGVTRYATNKEALDGISDERTITAKKLNHVFNTLAASETVQGTAKVSTMVAAAAGTDDKTIMTPKKVAHAISVQSPVVGIATEKSQGTVQLATLAQIQTGTAREGSAISPWGFKNARASDVNIGTVKIATNKEYLNGVSASEVPSIKTLFDNKADVGKFGIVALSKTKNTAKNTALASDASVVFATGGDTTGRITLNGKKYITEDEITGGLDVGMITFSAVVPKTGSSYVVCDGRALNKNTEKTLFAAIGYTFGGSGDFFNVPDMRGLFVKGVGKSPEISGLLGDDIEPTELGEVQAQQVRKHKHIGPWGVDRWDSRFGQSSNWNNCGSGRHDYNNPLYYTNDGTIWNGNPNPDGIIGNENRPWNISLYYVIKVR